MRLRCPRSSAASLATIVLPPPAQTCARMTQRRVARRTAIVKVVPVNRKRAIQTLFNSLYILYPHGKHAAVLRCHRRRFPSMQRFASKHVLCRPNSRGAPDCWERKSLGHGRQVRPRLCLPIRPRRSMVRVDEHDGPFRGHVVPPGVCDGVLVPKKGMAQDECISDTCTSTNYLWSGTWVSQLCEHRRPPKFQANLFEFVDLFPTQDTACDISPTEEECSVLDGFVYNKEDNSCQKACFEKHIQSKCVGTGGGGEWYRRVPEAK